MRILGTGSAAPKGVLTNDMLAEMVDTSDEWIRSRTGIKTRFIAKDETTLSLAREAAERALEASGVSRERIGLVVCATVSNEQRCPSLACFLQRDLGLREDILAFDLNAACSGFIYGLIVASNLVSEESYALVVGTEVLSALTDYRDRETCILFGDGAGAAVVAPRPSTAASGSAGLYWVSEACGNDEPLNITDFIHMDGHAVFKFAVETLIGNIRAVTKKAGLEPSDIDLFVCHQANERIIASAAKRLRVPLERFFMNLAQYGNTSAASVPIALDEAVRAQATKPGNKVVLAGFGGGLTAGAVYLTWS